MVTASAVTDALTREPSAATSRCFGRSMVPSNVPPIVMSSVADSSPLMLSPTPVCIRLLCHTRGAGGYTEEMSLSRHVARQVPPAVRAKGLDYFARGAVVHADGTASAVDAIVRGTRPYRVKLRRSRQTIAASCECKYFADRAGICKHIWAVLLHAEQQGDLTAAADDASRLRLLPEVPPAGAATRTTDDPPQWEKFFHEVSQKLARDEADVRPSRFRDAELIY